jgi:hypothetical protein
VQAFTRAAGLAATALAATSTWAADGAGVGVGAASNPQATVGKWPRPRWGVAREAPSHLRRAAVDGVGFTLARRSAADVPVGNTALAPAGGPVRGAGAAAMGGSAVGTAPGRLAGGRIAAASTAAVALMLGRAGIGGVGSAAGVGRAGMDGVGAAAGTGAAVGVAVGVGRGGCTGPAAVGAGGLAGGPPRCTLDVPTLSAAEHASPHGRGAGLSPCVRMHVRTCVCSPCMCVRACVLLFLCACAYGRLFRLHKLDKVAGKETALPRALHHANEPVRLVCSRD